MIIGYFMASFFAGWGLAKLMLYFRKLTEVVFDE